MVRVFENPESLARAVAEVIVERADASIRARSRFRLGVSGGATPARLYRLLASDSFRGRVDWARVDVFFADERAVPRDHPESNYRLLQETLLVPAGVPASNVHRLRTDEPTLEAAALEYESALTEPLDLVLLGIGADGHTASIFPDSPAVLERRRRVVVVRESPKAPAVRLTITPRVLDEARGIAVLASGAEKVRAVAMALEGDLESAEFPARLVRDRDWYLDHAAASQLAAVGR